MSDVLFTIDRPRIPLTTDADPTGFLGRLDTAKQACRAVFLAAEVGAIGWDITTWPDLAFGVWSDDPPEPARRSRRRFDDDGEPAEMSTWLQLRPEWPQLGGTGFAWPPPDDPPARAVRLEHLVDTTVHALNATFRSTLDMARGLERMHCVDSASSLNRHRPGEHVRSTSNGAHDHARLTGPSPIPLNGTDDSRARTFTASGIAGHEDEIGDILADLAHNAETNAALLAGGNGRGATVTQLSHAVTALPCDGERGLRNGRFLVTLTATLDGRGN